MQTHTGAGLAPPSVGTSVHCKTARIYKANLDKNQKLNNEKSRVEKVMKGNVAHNCSVSNYSSNKKVDNIVCDKTDGCVVFKNE